MPTRLHFTTSESGSTLTFLQWNRSDRLRSDGNSCLGLSHFQHVLIHLELWRLDNQHKPHKHVPRVQEREMCTICTSKLFLSRLHHTNSTLRVCRYAVLQACISKSSKNSKFHICVMKSPESGKPDGCHFEFN